MSLYGSELRVRPMVDHGQRRSDARGRAVRYRSLAGDWWPCIVLHRWPDVAVDIEVDRLKLTRVPVYYGTEADCPHGACMENPAAMQAVLPGNAAGGRV